MKYIWPKTLHDTKKGESRIGALLCTQWKAILISSYAKKIWSGERTCACANSIKKCFIVLVSSPHQLPLKTCLRSGKRKLKAMLFYLTWIPSIFDSFDAYSSVHCSSVRSYSLTLKLFFKHHCNNMEGLKDS